jgi:tRNA-2-methylthio-N6-dimethylallyladenosine synthase
VTTAVTRGAPHYLIADCPPLAIRRSRGGDAWEAGRDSLAGAGVGEGGPGPARPAPSSMAGSGGVLLGMPARRSPA